MATEIDYTKRSNRWKVDYGLLAKKSMVLIVKKGSIDKLEKLKKELDILHAETYENENYINDNNTFIRRLYITWLTYKYLRLTFLLRYGKDEGCKISFEIEDEKLKIFYNHPNVTVMPHSSGKCTA